MTTPRPQWVRDLQFFIKDEVLDESHGYPQEGESDWLHDLIEQAVDTILCNTFGHDMVDDQCGIPSHRYCVHCHARTPA